MCRVVTNNELAGMVDTSGKSIREQTGIRQRRIAAPEEALPLGRLHRLHARRHHFVDMNRRAVCKFASRMFVQSAEELLDECAADISRPLGRSRIEEKGQT